MIERGSVKYRRTSRFRYPARFWQVYGPLGGMVSDSDKTKWLSMFDRRKGPEFDGDVLTWGPTMIDTRPKDTFWESFDKFVEQEKTRYKR
jgi:hypothetical protein